MTSTVYCLASTEEQANSVLTELRNLDFPPSSISVVLPDRAETKNIAVNEDAIRGAETGGLIGGVLGWIAGLSSLAIPGVGAFLAAGPIIAALGGAAAGSMVGGLAGGSGAVHPLGVPAEVGKTIEGRLQSGQILVSVHSDDPLILKRAEQVFKASGAHVIVSPDVEAAA